MFVFHNSCLLAVFGHRSLPQTFEDVQSNKNGTESEKSKDEANIFALRATVCYMEIVVYNFITLVYVMYIENIAGHCVQVSYFYFILGYWRVVWCWHDASEPFSTKSET